MTKTLEMVFRDAAGKTAVISIISPRDGLLLADVQDVMGTVLNKNIFSYNGADLEQIVEARTMTKDTVTLA